MSLLFEIRFDKILLYHQKLKTYLMNNNTNKYKSNH